MEKLKVLATCRMIVFYKDKAVLSNLLSQKPSNLSYAA